MFYGLMTIWQQLSFSNRMEIPCGWVKDAPRYEYRGFMLDESRHFFGKEKVEQLLDVMSILKLNTFHWHLTDAPGWRLEIKAFPKLTTVGGRGNKSEPDAPAEFYSQEEIAEVVAYAADRFIAIIPEIDMPGHATAANRAYPEFSGGGSEKRPDFTFNPGKEETYEYLGKILGEVSVLFPSPYVHFGGDEVHFGNQQWANDESVRALMKREKLSDLREVEQYFSRRMADTIKALGKITAGWDEVVSCGLSNESTLVYWWRHDKPEQLATSLKGGYNTILCPRRPLYFDFVQHDTHVKGRRWDGFNPIQDVYQYPDSTHTFSVNESSLVKGIQACLWTETVTTTDRVDFLSFPRILALSESAWTNCENKEYSRFEDILPNIFCYLDKLDIYYFNSLNETLRSEP
jgi:hexosaminidase